MGLSEHEQRLLDEMERNLYKHEADIVETNVGPRVFDYTKVAFGVLGIAAGLVLIVVGVTMKLALLGVAGFGLAVAGALWALSASKPASGAEAQKPAGQGEGPVNAERAPGLMDRLAKEWDDRNRRE